MAALHDYSSSMQELRGGEGERGGGGEGGRGRGGRGRERENVLNGYNWLPFTDVVFFLPDCYSLPSKSLV